MSMEQSTLGADAVLDTAPNKSLQRTFDPQPISLSQNGPRLKRR
jgi:hypothetical protein